MAVLSATKPCLPVCWSRDLYVVVVIRDVLCECICGTLGIGDSLNKQKADNLSDVTPWPHFIFRKGIFLQLLGKVVSLPHETMHVSSQHFSCSDAQIGACVWTTRYHVRSWLWHNHLGSNSVEGNIYFFFYGFILAKSLPLWQRDRVGRCFFFLLFFWDLFQSDEQITYSGPRAQRTQSYWKRPNSELYS